MDARDLLFFIAGGLFGALGTKLGNRIAAMLGGGLDKLKISVTDDHQTIQRTALRNDHGGRPSVHLNIACAPSKKWPRPKRIDVGGCEAWKRDHIPELLDEPDFLSPTELLRYFSKRDHPDSRMQLNIHPDGLMEYSCPMTHEGPDDQIRLDLEEIGIALVRFVEAVKHGAYSACFGLNSERLKLDWYIGLSQGVTVQGRGWTAWQELEFPGHRPRARPSGMNPPLFRSGLAENQLTGTPLRTESLRLCKFALKDLLDRDGYRDAEVALEDTLRAISDRAIEGSE